MACCGSKLPENLIMCMNIQLVRKSCRDKLNTCSAKSLFVNNSKMCLQHGVLLYANDRTILFQNIQTNRSVQTVQTLKRLQFRSDTNRAVQPQKMAIGLKFLIQDEGGLYYL